MNVSISFSPPSSLHKQLDITRQPWYRLHWTRHRADRYLAPAPAGAFVVRYATNQGELVLSVQTGTCILYMLLRVSVENISSADCDLDL